MNDLQRIFEDWDSYPQSKLAFAAVIDQSMDLVSRLQESLPEFADKLASVEGAPEGNKYLRAAGALAQLWKAKELGIPQKPSTLGQALVIGGLGALGGYGAGKALDWMSPNKPFKFSRLGLVLGGAAGLTPAITGGVLNHVAGKPVLTSSFWDSPDKTASINVRQFNDLIWSDPDVSRRLPPNIQAAASGLVTGASNLPGRPKNSPFVTPVDIARMAVGLGSGATSGWLVGKGLGAFMGLSKPAQNALVRSGAAAGLIKNLVPIAFGGV